MSELAAAAAASQAEAARAATAMLARGNAVDAVAAGVLAAAAEEPGVLLGPLQMLIGGAGAGLLAIDGRVTQPGRGARRPRGFLSSEEVAEACKVATPMLPAALAVAIATRGAGPLHWACEPAIELARGRSRERAAVLEAFAQRGAPAMGEPPIAAELLAVAGRPAQGLLTHDDLSLAMPRAVGIDPARLERDQPVFIPWVVEGGAVAPADAGTTQVVAAIDARGLAAIACFEAPIDGLAIPALGLVAPRLAEPVMRGRPRVTPGSPRPAAAPIALIWSRGTVDYAVGIAATEDAPATLRSLLEGIAREPTLAQAPATPHGGRSVVVARGARGVRAFVG